MSGINPTTVMSVAAARAADRSLHEAADVARVDSLAEKRVGRALDSTLAALARELAMDLDTTDAILRRHGFDLGLADPGWAELNANEAWVRLLGEQIREWNTADSTKKRVMLKSQVALEAALPGMFGLSQDPNEPAMARLKAVELLGRFGGIGVNEGNGSGGAGGGFSVRISLSTGQKVNVIDQNGNAVGSAAGAGGVVAVDNAVDGRVVQVDVVNTLRAPGFLLSEPTPDDSAEDDS